MRILGCEICSYKPIIFGDLVAKQFVLFEHKRLFGIIFFYFKGKAQDRFHTHAFNALSVKLFGKYTEGVLEYDKGRFPEVVAKFIPRTQIFKYFPRDCYHSINESNGCMTMLIQGPWKKTWKECKLEKTDLYMKYPLCEGTKKIVEEKTLTWHRNEVTSS